MIEIFPVKTFYSTRYSTKMKIQKIPPPSGDLTWVSKKSKVFAYYYGKN